MGLDKALEIILKCHLPFAACRLQYLMVIWREIILRGLKYMHSLIMALLINGRKQMDDEEQCLPNGYSGMTLNCCYFTPNFLIAVIMTLTLTLGALQIQ